MIIREAVCRNALVLTCAALIALAAAPWVAAQSRSIVREVVIGDGAGYLGIQMAEVTSDNMATYKLAAERGVVVQSVEKGSPAETAGLQEKDVILELSGIPVLSTQQFARMVRELPPGRKVDLAVSRDGKKLNLSAKLGKNESGGMVGAVRPGARVEPGSPLVEPREFDFSMPGGRAFRFQAPNGRMFQFDGPAGGTSVWSAEKPKLGVTLQPLTEQLAEHLGVTGKKGVLVTGTISGTPAAAALKAGDVIVRANDTAVDSPEELSRIVRGKDGKIELKVVRDRKEVSVSVELSASDSKPKPRGFTL
jgi:serine protease Do